jgi:HK97 family phage portal protein
MNFLSHLFNLELRGGVSSTLGNPAEWLTNIFRGSPTASGTYVTEFTALKNTAVWAAVRILAESVGFLPLLTYERLDGGGKQRAIDHPLYRLLHDQPNRYMSSVTFRETLQGHLALWGNAYAEIQWAENGQAIALWPLLPNQVWPEIRDGKLFYRVTVPKGPQVILSPDDVLHVPGLGFDGVKGYSPIAMVREALGLAAAGEEFAARFYSNGASVSGILEHPQTLSKEAGDRLRKDVESRYTGLTNAHRMMILEEGMKFGAAMPLREAQFIEGRTFQIAEVARTFHVPLHMLAELSHATFDNIEYQSLEFVIFTLGPWLRRWEQELNRKLFSAWAQKRFFVEFQVDGLLRGDFKSRMEGYSIARNGGWMSADDIRDLENQNPLPDGAGKIYLMPLNMADASKPAPPTAAPTVPALPSAPKTE